MAAPCISFCVPFLMSAFIFPSPLFPSFHFPVFVLRSSGLITMLNCMNQLFPFCCFNDFQNLGDSGLNSFIRADCFELLQQHNMITRPFRLLWDRVCLCMRETSADYLLHNCPLFMVPAGVQG